MENLTAIHSDSVVMVSWEPPFNHTCSDIRYIIKYSEANGSPLLYTQNRTNLEHPTSTPGCKEIKVSVTTLNEGEKGQEESYSL